MAIRDTPHRSTTTRLFSIRCAQDTFDQLKQAAKEDGLTVNDELLHLLSHREQ